jgi:hypothetical protein
MKTTPDVLYSDGLITIKRDALIFHHYYFPGIKKTLPINDIERINGYEPTVWNGKWRIWGTGGANVWFPLDVSRPSRDRIYFVSLKNTAFRIGFTVKDPAQVENIFKEMHLLA